MSSEFIEEGAIQELPEGYMTAGRVKLSPHGMDIPDDVTFDEYVRAGALLDGFARLASESLPWWIGDFINYGIHKFPDVYGQAMDLTDYSYGTLMNYAYVSRQVPPANRNLASFGHAMSVAPYSEKDQRKYLMKSNKEGLTIREMRLMIAGVDNYKNPVIDNRKEDPVGAALSAFNSIWERHQSQWLQGRPREVAFDVWKKCLEVVYKRGMG